MGLKGLYQGVTMLVAALAVIAYLLCFPVFYGIFSFGDHESWDCYATQDKEVLLPWDGSGDQPADLHNVYDDFHMVNLWGFINWTVAPFGILLFGGCFGCLASSEAGGIVAAILGCLLALSYISQFITMCVMRWRHAGRVCAGDFTDDLHFWSPTAGKDGEPYLH